MIHAIILFVLIYVSHQTDIELQPFEDATEITTIRSNESSTLSFINETTTIRALTTIEKCLLVLNISSDDFEQNISDITYGNYLSCLWKSKKLQLDNGQINFTLLEEMINVGIKICVDITDVPLLNAEHLASEIMTQCKGVDGKTHGEKAVKLRNCLYGKLLYQRKGNDATYDFEDIPYLEIEEETCVLELKLDALEIEDTNRRYLVSEKNIDFQKFLECYWKEIDYMDKNGTLNITLLENKFIEDIEFEILSRSRAAYLTDILTTSIINGIKTIKGNSDGELVLYLQNYILRRLPYFNILLQYQ